MVEDALTQLAKWCEIAVITLGDKGCLAMQGTERVAQKAFKVGAYTRPLLSSTSAVLVRELFLCPVSDELRPIYLLTLPNVCHKKCLR